MLQLISCESCMLNVHQIMRMIYQSICNRYVHIYKYFKYEESVRHTCLIFLQVSERFHIMCMSLFLAKTVIVDMKNGPI